MEQRIRDRYNDRVFSEALKRLGGGAAEPLDGFESFIYNFERGREELVLRIGHSLRRSEALILGEVDWINFLADRGAPVARAVRSERGHLVEALDDGQGGSFLATSFVRARGIPPYRRGWSSGLTQDYGELIGALHDLSRSYEPTEPAWRRPEWDDPLMLDVERFLPEGDEEVRSAYREVLERIASFPRDGNSYGLIHQDAHGGNFLVDEDGGITLFDFDDCVYCWYAFDLAMVAFYRVCTLDEPERILRGFFPDFLAGYARRASLDPEWLRWIPDFLTLREIDLYALLHRSFDVEALEDPWCVRFLDGRRERIMERQPFIDVDFCEFAS